MATRFIPVRGAEESILAMELAPGKIYFCTDSGKIYLDTEERRIAVGGSGSGGGNSSILYANSTAINEHQDGYFHISVTDLTDSTVLNVPKDTLVINQDGAFYRVEKYENNTLYCKQITVAGGGGGSSLAKKIYVDLTKKINTSNYINGQSAYAIITPHSGLNSEGVKLEDDLSVTWRLATKNGTEYVTYATGTLDLQDGEAYEFDFGSRAKESATSFLFVEASGIKSGASESMYFNFTTMDLTLEKSSSFKNTGVYSYDNVVASVNINGNMDKIVDYYWDGELVHTDILNASSDTGQSCKFNTYVSEITHGYHTVKVELHQSIQGVRGIGTEPIEMEIAVNAGGEEPIIWFGDYATSYYSYDDIRIPYFVYDPSHLGGFTVELLKDNGKIGKREFTGLQSGLASSTFEITDAEVGIQNYYSITCGDARRDIYFNVTKDPTRDMNVQKALYLTTSFDAKGRSNDESATSRQTLVFGEGENAISAQFNNFNWYNNGWVKGTDGNTCLRISNGASFIIPIGQMQFANSSDQKSQSHTFEFQFRIRNVQNYDSLIKNITRYKGDTNYYNAFYGYISYDEDESNAYDINANYFVAGAEEGTYVDAAITDAAKYAEVKAAKTVYIGTLGYKTRYTNYDAFLKWYADQNNLNVDDITAEYDYTEKRFDLSAIACGFYSGKAAAPIGFGLGPQDAFFTNGTNTVNASYVEDKLVNLSITYNHSNKLMSIYVNGILTGVIFSTLENPFTIASSNIVFNSTICDIDLYKFRIYNTALSLNDVVTNYAVDLKNVMVYDQNAIAVENNAINEYQFSYTKMLEYNSKHPAEPIMPYIIFDTSESDNEDRLSWSKSTKPTIQVEFINTALDRAYESGELDELAAKDGVTVADYYMHHCPSFKSDKVEMAVQGTSSEFYPRRNYKLKMKDSDSVIHFTVHKGPFANANQHTDWFYMDNYKVGTTKFTMKIDFMESSGSYNRGLANLLKNAYAQHPLEIYAGKGAIAEGKDEYNIATSFAANTQYFYYNHKDNIKPADGDGDNLPALTAETFAKGPMAYYQELMAADAATYSSLKAVAESKNAEHYNKWYTGGTVYTPKTTLKFSELRTTVQGYPVLAFHKKSDGSYTYIGRYNMLSDKGSDEMYGFKGTGYYAAHLNNAKTDNVAECWEFENNQRGFCSFRDPLNRKHLSFNTETWDEKYRPSLLQDFEYRYNALDKSFDIICEPDVAKGYSLDSLSATQIAQIKKDTKVEVANENVEKTQQLIFDLYGNWEKACQWVWSTALDATFVRHDYTTLSESELRNKLYEIDPIAYPKPTTVDGQTVDPLAGHDKGYFYNLFMSIDANSVDKQNSLDKMTEDQKKQFLIEDYFEVKDTDAFKADGKYYTYELHLYKPYTATEATWAADKAKGLYELRSYTKQFTSAGTTYVYDSYEYRCAKFKAELEDHFDMDYLATYFVVTEVLELYDSRGKNCMMASWGPQKAGGDYVWFPIFYDMDTQLGINNTGIPSFEYYIDATDEGSYSTNDSVLWNNFYLLFKDRITQKYCQLKGQTEGIGEFKKLDYGPFSSVKRIEAWYESEPTECKSIVMRGVRPLSAINLDEYYKYISITNGLGPGYQGQTGGYLYDNSDTATGQGTPTGSYFYALQGDRSLSRQQFLTNRLNYLESWLGVGSYQKSGSNDTAFWGRIRYNTLDGTTSDNWVKTEDPTYAEYKSDYYDASGNKINEFDGEYWMTVTPSRKSYVKLIADDVVSTEKYTDTPVQVTLNSLESAAISSPRYKEQLLYILGIDIIQSLGNLHNLYFTELHTINAPNLTSLVLGWDGKDKNGLSYKNYQTNRHTFSSMPLLKELNLSNIQYKEGVDKTLDFSNSEKLENFRATGSNFTQIKFASGVALNTLYLPTTITELKLTEARQLKNVITEYHTPVHDEVNDTLTADKGLYIEHFTEYLDDVSNVDCQCNFNTLSIINASSLGYDAYKLLKGYYNKRNADKNNSAIDMTEVDWMPYKKVDAGSLYNLNNTYVIDNFHFGFDAYTYTTKEKWETDIANGVLYIKKADVDGSVINNIAMLEDMVKNNYFKNTSSGSIPNITGAIYIDNNATLTTTTAGTYTDLVTNKAYTWAVGDPVDEYYVRNVLGNQYPGLTFFFKTIEKNKTARFVLMSDPSYELVTETLSAERIATGYYYQKASDGSYALATSYSSSGTYYKDVKKDQYDLIGIQTIKDGFFFNPITTYGDISEAKANFDFYGWANSATAGENDVLVNGDTNAEGKFVVGTINNWPSSLEDASVLDYTFYAIFSIHKYVMTFYNGDGTTYISKIPFGDAITDPREVLPSNQTALMVTYKDDSALLAAQTYGFKGWTTSNNAVADGTKPAYTYGDIITLSNFRSSKNRTFFPVFEVKDVHQVITPESYFVFKNGRLAPKVPLRGKITIPATYNGQDVLEIGDVTFDNVTVYTFACKVQSGIVSGLASEVTGIFFPSNTKVKTFVDGAFKNAAALEVIEYPTTLEKIGQGTFQYCYSLKSSDLTSASNLKEIGDSAYNNAWDGRENEIEIALPASVTTIGLFVFYYYGNSDDDIARRYYYNNVRKQQYIKEHGSEIGYTNINSFDEYTKSSIKIVTIGGPDQPTMLNKVGTTSMAGTASMAFDGVDSIVIYYDNTSATAESDITNLLTGYAVSTYPAYQ